MPVTNRHFGIALGHNRRHAVCHTTDGGISYRFADRFVGLVSPRAASCLGGRVGSSVDGELDSATRGNPFAITSLRQSSCRQVMMLRLGRKTLAATVAPSLTQKRAAQ